MANYLRFIEFLMQEPETISTSTSKAAAPSGMKNRQKCQAIKRIAPSTQRKLLWWGRFHSGFYTKITKDAKK